MPVVLFLVIGLSLTSTATAQSWRTPTDDGATSNTSGDEWVDWEDVAPKPPIEAEPEAPGPEPEPDSDSAEEPETAEDTPDDDSPAAPTREGWPPSPFSQATIPEDIGGLYGGLRGGDIVSSYTLADVYWLTESEPAPLTVVRTYLTVGWNVFDYFQLDFDLGGVGGAMYPYDDDNLDLPELEDAASWLAGFGVKYVFTLHIGVGIELFARGHYMGLNGGMLNGRGGINLIFQSDASNLVGARLGFLCDAWDGTVKQATDPGGGSLVLTDWSINNAVWAGSAEVSLFNFLSLRYIIGIDGHFMEGRVTFGVVW